MAYLRAYQMGMMGDARSRFFSPARRAANFNRADFFRMSRQMAVMATKGRQRRFYGRLLQGDPGLFSAIAKFGGGLLRKVPGVGKLLGKALPFLPGVGGLVGKLAPAIAGGVAAGAAGSLAGHLFGGGGGAGTGRRRYRRQDVSNVHALRRAIRRVKGFAKLARSTVHIASTVRMRKGARGRKR